MIKHTLLIKLLAALAVVESNNNDNAVGDQGQALGRYQIHSSVVIDVNRSYGTHYNWTEMDDPVKARDVAEKYLEIYVPRKGFSPHDKTKYFEHCARCWNAGPDYWDKAHLTDAYWIKVQLALRGLRAPAK